MKYLRALLTVALAAVLAALPLAAQSGVTGTLTGIVTQDGAPLPGVTVTVSSPNLQGTRSTITNEAGGYNFGALPAGEYTVTYALEGLTPTTRMQRIGVAQNARLDVEMSLAAVAESITVTAAAPAVAESTEVQTNLTGDLVDELPVGRTMVAITTLAPGVTSNGPGNNLMISGGQSFDNLYTVNGAVVQENLRGQPHNLFIEDAIQETTVTQAGVSAEFGNFTGGVVNVITKSGGNEFSGTLRDSLSNPSWTADSPDTYRLGANGQPQRVSSSVVDALTHTYEATLGGRILRDRLWFFLSGRSADEQRAGSLQNGRTFTSTIEDTRLEVKLTGAITPSHNLMASYLQAPRVEANTCQSGAGLGCFDESALSLERELPNDFLSMSYNGVLTSNLLIEARYSEKYFAFVRSGGTDTSLAGGTPIQIFTGTLNGIYTNESPFCGVCDDEERNNQQWGAKATYFLGSRSLGSHNIVAGYDYFGETRLANNYQSPTNFRIRVGSADPTVDENGRTRISLVSGENLSGDDMIWFPIDQLSPGSDLKTTAFYLNDKWDVSPRLSLNLGVRYDQNDSQDSAGNVIAKDSKVSPRLGVSWEALMNGRLRVGANYGHYVGRLAETVAGIGSAAGTPATYIYDYQGPELHDLLPEEAAAAFFAWFNANGGTTRTPAISQVPGFSQRIEGTLVTPSVEEWTVNASTEIGNGFLRVDYIHRDWQDFYGVNANMNIGTVTSSTGQRADLNLYVNTNDLERRYDAFQIQAAYRLGRFHLGGNYTWSELIGNIVGETVNAGPTASGTDDYYPEYLETRFNNPVGFLPQDQTHKLRAWASTDLPTSFGKFNFSVLQRWDSGTPYSLLGTINVGANANFYGPGLAGGIANPGYVSPANGSSQTYYFSERGAFRFDDLWATDLAVNYETDPAWLRGVHFFVQGELLNLFNNDALLAWDTSVVTQSTAGSGLQRFNPHAGDVPVEGVHYRLGALHGLPTTPTTQSAAGHHQLPRTYRFSFGLRF